MNFIYVAMVAAALSAVGTWRVQEWRWTSKAGAAQEQAREDRARHEKTIDTAAVRHEADKAQLRTEFVTITQEVERVVEKPVYRDVCLDDDGMHVLRAAVGFPAAAASQPAPAVPGPAAAGGR